MASLRRSLQNCIEEAQPRTQAEAHGAQLRALWELNRPDQGAAAGKAAVIKHIQAIFDAAWPGAELQLVPFGSSYTGICAHDSDLDLVLLDPSRPLGPDTPPHRISNDFSPWSIGRDGMPEWYDVRRLAKELDKDNRKSSSAIMLYQVSPIASAKVPIVRLNARGVAPWFLNGLRIDIAVNNRLGLANSKLIEAYANLRPALVRPLCFTVKHWLKVRGLNEPNPPSGPRSLSSYTIVLMVISFLQQRGCLPDLQDPYLLNLTRLPRTFSYWAGGKDDVGKKWNITFFDPDRRNKTLRRLNESPASQDDAAVRGWVHYAYRWKTTDKNGREAALSEWLDDHDELVQSPLTRKLPPPRAVGLHRQDPASSTAQLEELGLQFQHFISWTGAQIAQALHSKPMSPAVISVAPMLLPEQGDEIWKSWRGCHLIVQDPFHVSRNTATNVTRPTVVKIEQEAQRALRILHGRNWNISRLYEKVQ